MNAEERLIAYLCQNPGTEHMDTHHAEVARQILAQHSKELAEASPWPWDTADMGVIPLADLLRATSTALADRTDIAATDDPLTLLRCLHATVQALTEITPGALAAADITNAPGTTDGIANIPGLVALGLKGATSALWDAYNAV